MAFAVALALWGVGVAAFAALPAGSSAGPLVVDATYCAAAVFVSISVARAVRRSRSAERLFWSIFGAGLLLGFVGDLGWSAFEGEAFAGGLDAFYGAWAYLLSYLVLVGALAVLVHATTRRITAIALLDAVAVLFSTGLLVWFFFLGRVAEEAGGGIAVLAAFSWPLFDAALLFLSLVVLSSTGKPPYTGPLAAGFVAFALADGAYLVSSSEGRYTASGWPDLLWALGLVLLALGALRSGEGAPRKGESIAPWRQLAFWLGPLSPPVHLAVVLFSCSLGPQLPPYVAAGGAVIALYLALRAGLVAFAVRRLHDEGKEAAGRQESTRVLRELHGTVKGGAHGVSLVLKGALEAERRGDHAGSRALMEAALKAARELEYGASKPYEELGASDDEDLLRPAQYLRGRLDRFEEYFGVRTHDDLQAPLEDLSPVEVSVVYRVVTEALWNVAKHANARNLWLASRRVGSTLLVRVRDDGRGFDASNPPPGLGLRYMRRRAEEAGAKLDVISNPGSGTTVQLRFEERRGDTRKETADAQRAF